MQRDGQQAAVGIAGSLIASAVVLAVAPAFAPDGYDWVTHTTSDAAAQGLPNAWIARLGFLLFGLAVCWLTVRRRDDWPRYASAFHAAFGVFMTATAAFSTRPWDATIPYSPVEDALHSATATLLGACFALGVSTILVHRHRHALHARRLDVVALAATVVIPVAMTNADQYAGVLQRLMFLVAYAWYLRETAEVAST